MMVKFICLTFITVFFLFTKEKQTKFSLWIFYEKKKQNELIFCVVEQLAFGDMNVVVVVVVVGVFQKCQLSCRH